MSLSAALLLMTAAVLLWPGLSRPTALGSANQMTTSVRWRDAVRQGQTGSRWIVAATVTVSTVIALLAPWHAALSAGVLTGVAAWSWSRARVRRSESARAARDVETLHALAAELRAGNDLVAALRAAGTVAQTPLCQALHRAAQTILMGGDAAESLARSDSVAAQRLAGLVRMSATRGIALADAVEVLAADATARADANRDVASLLAGPRATAALLTLLPGFGLVLGQSIGADPVGVLLHSTAGAISMVAGTLLAAAGVLWTHSMVRSAEQ